MISAIIAIFLTAYLFNVKINCLLKYLTNTENNGIEEYLYNKWGILSGFVYMCVFAVLFFFTETPTAYFQLADLTLSLILAAIVDVKFHIIPNIMTAAMMITQLLCSFLLLKSGINYVNVIVAVILALILLLISKISKEQIGFGDIKLLIAVALIYGLSFALYSMIFSLIAMLIFSVPLLVMKKINLKTPMPFAPFYVLGTLTYIIINFL